jgi:hypothetical protein
VTHAGRWRGQQWGRRSPLETSGGRRIHGDGEGSDEGSGHRQRRCRARAAHAGRWRGSDGGRSSPEEVGMGEREMKEACGGESRQG